MKWTRKTGVALAANVLVVCLLLVLQAAAPASSLPPARPALAADRGALTLPLVAVSSFSLDLAAQVGGTTVPLGAVTRLANVGILPPSFRPLPSTTIQQTVPVAGTTATYSLVLAVDSFDPFTVSVSNLQISLATGPSVSVPGSISLPVSLPVDGAFSVATAPQDVTGVGQVTFIFSGAIKAIRTGS